MLKSAPLLESKTRFDYVDCLRGLAILAVIGTHIGERMQSPQGVFKGVLNYGLYGVQLFFVASALTLSFSWNSQSSRNSSPLISYALRRFFRIAPLYFAGILFYHFFDPFGREKSTFADGGGEGWHLLFLHGFNPIYINRVVPGGWTVGVEVLFYVLFPLLISTIRNIRSAAVAFVGATVVVSALANFWIRPALQGTFSTEKWDWNFFYFWLPNQLPTFLGGILAYHAILVLNGKKEDPRRTRALSLLALGAAMLVFFLTTRWVPPWLKMGTLGLSFGLLAVSLSLCPWRILVNPWICKIGRLSFALYLTHWIGLVLIIPPVEKVLLAWTRDAPLHRDLVHFGCFFVMVGASCLVAWPLHFLIEKPGIRLGQKLILRLTEKNEKSLPVLTPKSLS